MEQNGPGLNLSNDLERTHTMTDLPAFEKLAAADQGLVVFSTLRRDGSAQASVVNAGVLPHPLTNEPVVGLVAIGGARKLAHLRADPRTTVTARSGWQWATVEGTAQLIGPDDSTQGAASSMGLSNPGLMTGGGQGTGVPGVTLPPQSAYATQFAIFMSWSEMYWPSRIVQTASFSVANAFSPGAAMSVRGVGAL